MRNTVSLIIFLSLHNAAQANGIPSSGFCKQADSESSVLFPFPSITWEENRATLIFDDETIDVKIYGMRPHGEHFKFSAFYTDETMGLSEVIFFGYESSGGLKFRMGIVTYDESSEGIQVVSAMSGFREATCTVWR